MPTFTPEEINALLNALSNRKEEAIKAPRLAQILGYSSRPNQERLRALIRQAIEEGHLIGSYRKGYWLIIRLDELNELLDSLEHRAQGTCLRRNHLLNAWNEQHPDNRSAQSIKNVN